MGESATCAKCGAPVSPGTRYCPSCGSDVSGQQGNVATAYVPKADMQRATMNDAALLESLRHATMGEYEVFAELGRGGMASVFLAHDISLDRKVAIKVLAPALQTGEGMIERFKREARTAAALSHPHIIPIFAVRESEHMVYFVMKFVEGRSLESIVKELGQVPISMAQSILQQVGAALGYAHRRGVVHRDVKPANVMIDADGWAVVTDFGIAKVTEAKGLTMTGATIGTPTYMSPEQCAAKDITGASDQYSFGIVAYEMLAGKQPFTGDSIMAIMYQHFNEPPPPLLTARPDCPPELADAVTRMLAKDPAQRFPDMDAAVAALGGVPLAPDDPIRTQLMTLAATGVQSAMLKTISTPRTPLPAGKTRQGRGKVEPTTGMTLSPAQVTVAVGGAVQLTASRRSRAGATVPGTAITWASTNGEVATVDDNGLVTAVAPGSAIITATMGTVSATGTVTVTAKKGAARKLVGVLTTVALLGGSAFAAWKFGPWGSGGTQGQQQANVVPTGAAPVTPTRGDSGTAARTDSQPTSTAPPPTRTPARTESRTPPRVAAAAPDTVLPRLRRDAEGVRAQAVAAGATSAELAGGDLFIREAQTLETGGRPADARARLSDAVASFNAAIGAARTRAAQAAAPPPRQEAPPPVTAPVDPRPQIEAAIQAYGRALESRNVGQVRQVYPAIRPAQERSFSDFFRSVQDLRVILRPGSPQLVGGVTGGSAEVVVAATMEFTQGGNRQSQQSTFTAVLERGPTGSWLIQEIR